MYRADIEIINAFFDAGTDPNKATGDTLNFIDFLSPEKRKADKILPITKLMLEHGYRPTGKGIFRLELPSSNNPWWSLVAFLLTLLPIQEVAQAAQKGSRENKLFYENRIRPLFQLLTLSSPPQYIRRIARQSCYLQTVPRELLMKLKNIIVGSAVWQPSVRIKHTFNGKKQGMEGDVYA